MTLKVLKIELPKWGADFESPQDTPYTETFKSEPFKK